MNYCHEKIAPRGSSFYLSLRPLTHAQRDAVTAIAAFYREIEDVVWECQEIQLAQTKLNWWRREVANIALKKATHPVTMILQQHTISTQRLLELIDGVEEKLTLTPFHRFDDFVVHLMRGAGKRELLIIDALKLTDSLSEENSYQVTLLLELAYYIQHLRRHLDKDFIYFSVDELQKFNLPRAFLRNREMTNEFQNLLQYQFDKIEHAYQNLQPLLNSSKRVESRHFLIRCEIAYKTLQEIRASQFNVLDHFIDLTPLRKWWLSWAV